MRRNCVLKEMDKDVQVIFLNRPKVMNCLSDELVQQLLDDLAEFEKNTQSRALIIAGKGKAFCAGRDLKEALEMAKQGLLIRRGAYQKIARLMARLWEIRKPIIAAVSGYALAGGCGLAASCDVLIASEDAKFGVPEVRVGVVPGTVTAALFRSVGRRATTELILTGDTIDAQEARRIGLVNKIVKNEDLISEAIAIARRIAANSATAISIWKESVHRHYDSEYTELVHALADIVTLGSYTDDSREGLLAFLDKRKPAWKIG